METEGEAHEWEKLDRRVTHAEFLALKAHVDARLDKQDKILTEIRDYFMFGKIGSRLLLGIAALTAAASTIWAAWGKK